MNKSIEVSFDLIKSYGLYKLLVYICLSVSLFDWVTFVQFAVISVLVFSFFLISLLEVLDL